MIEPYPEVYPAPEAAGHRPLSGLEVANHALAAAVRRRRQAYAAEKDALKFYRYTLIQELRGRHIIFSGPNSLGAVRDEMKQYHYPDGDEVFSLQPARIINLMAGVDRSGEIAALAMVEISGDGDSSSRVWVNLHRVEWEFQRPGLVE